MENMSILQRLNKHTRAGKTGKVIICSQCRKTAKVYHFSWSGLTCCYCKAIINKEDWLEGKNIKKKNNRFEKELETAVNNLTDKRFEELAKTYNLRKI